MKKEVAVAVISSLLTAFIIYITGLFGGLLSNSLKQDVGKILAQNKSFQSAVAEQVQPSPPTTPDLEVLKEQLAQDQIFQKAVADQVQPGLNPQNLTPELEKLIIAPPVWASGTNEHETSGGLINERNLRFKKRLDTSAIRIGYTDNLRVYGTGEGCQWEVLIDGKPCPSGRLVYGYFAGPTVNNAHRSRQVVGYCKGLASGDHSIQVEVGKVPGIPLAECRAGWKNSTWTLEVQEVPDDPS